MQVVMPERRMLYLPFFIKFVLRFSLSSSIYGNAHVAGSTDTIVMNAAKFVWSVVTSVTVRDPLACEVCTKQYLHNCAVFNHKDFSHKLLFQNLIISDRILACFFEKNNAPEVVK
jgi:hypothetical protein